MKKNLRQFNDNSPITMCIDSATAPLIKLSQDGGIDYYNSKSDKLRALKERKETDTFIIAWAGKWKTDVFEVTEFDINFVL